MYGRNRQNYGCQGPLREGPHSAVLGPLWGPKMPAPPPVENRTDAHGKWLDIAQKSCPRSILKIKGNKEGSQLNSDNFCMITFTKFYVIRTTSCA